jgi:AraC-like DNA-binding protein
MLSCDHYTFVEPHEFDASVWAGNAETVVTGPGKYQFELTQVAFENLWMQSGFISLPTITHTAAKHGHSVIYFLAEQSEGPVLHNGKELSAVELVAVCPDGQYHRRTSGSARWMSMSLSHADLAAAGRVLVGREAFAPPATHVVRPRPDLLARLRRTHAAVRRIAVDAPGVLEAPEVAKAIEQELIRRMISCYPVSLGTAEHQSDQRRITTMRKFEEFLSANPERPLYLLEICAAIGVSGRTLRTNCLEHLGVGPARYLWLRRMHLAREALLLSAPTSATVTSVANDYGFGELGRFAVSFRQLFNESPSATLARKPTGPASCSRSHPRHSRRLGHGLDAIVTGLSQIRGSPDQGKAPTSHCA